MNISRFNADFGNSMYMNLVDGYYFEMPTNVVEISEEKADGYFTSSIDEAGELLDRLLISITIEEKERFFLVGEIAEKEVLGNNHIKKLHDKVKSHIPLVTFLAAASYYQAIKGESNDTEININFFQTMLPIWLLKKLNKFSEMQERMSLRFKGQHKVKVLTMGAEKELTINVEESKCRVESEIARWAIKKNFDLEDNKDAEQFKNHDVVMVDLGGGTDDLVLLPAGLKAPKNRDSFEYFTDVPFLSHLEDLRKSKLVEHFDEVRALEKFIFTNINKSKLEQRDGNTGKTYDHTNIIKKSLKEYAAIKIEQSEHAFPAPKDRVYKYVYIGGVAPVIEEAIKEVTEERFGRDIAEANHIVHPEARKVNLYGLEILSRAEEQKRKQTQTV